MTLSITRRAVFKSHECPEQGNGLHRQARLGLGQDRQQHQGGGTGE